MIYNPEDPVTGEDGFLIAAGAYTDPEAADAKRLELINDVIAEGAAETEDDLAGYIFVLATDLDPDTSEEVHEESDG